MEKPGLIKDLYSYAMRINVYTDVSSWSVHRQIIATRLYLGLLTITLFVLLAFSASNAQIKQATINSPTQSQFEYLVDRYPSTLSCPCSQVTIPYKQFLSFAPQYHQVCSSDFVSQSWITALFQYNITYNFPADFRTSASSQFQAIALICHTINHSVSNILQEFGDRQLITSRALSPSAFHAQSAALVQQIETMAVTDITNMDQYITLSISENHLVSALHTNYFIYSVPGSRLYTTDSSVYVPINFTYPIDSNTVCDCEYSYDCFSKSAFYNNWTIKGPFYYLIPDPPPIYIVPGMLTGCTPRNSIFKSTLECFYNLTCLNTVRNLIGNIVVRKPMDTKIQSRFQFNQTIESMFSDLLIESWNNISNFTGYFFTCAPASCSYTYTQRFNTAYVFLTLFGLLGGLTVAFHMLTPLFIEKICYPIKHLLSGQCFRRHITASRDEQVVRQSIGMHLTGLCYKVKEHALKLNLFDKSALLLDQRQSRFSTLLYFILIIISILILSVYSAISLHTVSVTIYNPTQAEFEQSYAQYFLTLSCPCTHLSMTYSKFMSIRPRFHQICSSQFIMEDEWLTYFVMIPVPNMTRYGDIYYPLDFRQSAGQAIFRLMKTMCQLANDTVSYALKTFDNTEYFSAEPLSSEKFHIEISSLMQQFEEQTIASFLALLSLIRFSIENNHFYVSSVPNFAQSSFTINGSWSLRYKPKTFYLPNNQTCTCLTSNRCIRPQGFYCSELLCHTVDVMPTYTIPGLVMGCFPINSLLFSTLECLYDSSCIQMILDKRLFDLEGQFYPIELNVSALDRSIPSRFLPNTTMEEILSYIMIEEWISKINITAHYHECKPYMCTYTYVARYNTLTVITTVLGLSGGLSLALRLIIPLIVKLLLHKLPTQTKNETSPQNRSVINYIRDWLKYIRSSVTNALQTFLSLNMFHDAIEFPIFTTRTYLFVLTISFSIVLLFTRLGQHIHISTYQSPSEATFEDLYNQYGTQGLSCPCSQNSIQYDKFVSVSAVYHQICSSDFIQSTWWLLVASTGDTYALKDQPLLSSYFRMLAALCTLANETVTNAAQAFVSNTFVSVETLSRKSFENQMQLSLNSFIQKTPTTFVRRLSFITDALRSNQIQNMFMTTWRIIFTTAAEDYMVATLPVSYNNGTCTCATLLSPTCWRPLVFVLANATSITLPGLVAGCLPIDGLRLSTLVCFFDTNCLAALTMLVNNIMVPRALNMSLPTRFSYMTTTLGSIIDQLFVEEWISTSNYSNYYQTCAPRACRFTLVEPNDALYMITTLLGFYGGLTITVRFFVLHILLVFRRLRQRYFSGHTTRVHATPANC